MTQGADALVAAVRVGATRYAGCPEEQALVYSCEDTLEAQLATRTLDAVAVEDFVRTVCEAEDLDAPLVAAGRATRAVASADLDAHALCVNRPIVTALTVLHELAHLSCRVDSHGVLFRDELVRLCRAHVGIEHAALLHRLFDACRLEISPWAASQTRHR